MGFNRALVSPDGKLPQPLRQGDGIIANVNVFEHAADAAFTLTTAQLSGGFIAQTTDLTAGRIMTTPTAALIAAEWPDMDIGDSFMFVVSANHAGAFDLTVAGGVGVTLKGSGIITEFTSRVMVLVKTGAATFDLY